MKHLKKALALLLAAVMLAGLLAAPALADGDCTITIWNWLPGVDYYACKVFDLGADGKYTYTAEGDDDAFLDAILNGIGTGDTAIASPFTVTQQGSTGVYEVALKSGTADADTAVTAFLDSMIENEIWVVDDIEEYFGTINNVGACEIEGLDPGYYYVTICYGRDSVYSRIATVNVGGNVEIFEKTLTAPQWGESNIGKGIVRSVLEEGDEGEKEVAASGKDIAKNYDEGVGQFGSDYNVEKYSLDLVSANSANIGEDMVFHIAVDAPTYVRDKDDNVNLITWYNIQDEIEDGFEYSFIEEFEGEETHYLLDETGFAVYFRPYTWDDGKWKLGDRELASPYEEEMFKYGSGSYCYRFEGLKCNDNLGQMEFEPSESGEKPDPRAFNLQIPFGTTMLNNMDSPFVRIEVFYRARLKPDAENVKIANLREPDTYNIANLNTASFSYYVTPIDDDFDPDDYDYGYVADEYPEPAGDPVSPDDNERTTKTYTYALLIEKYPEGDDAHLLPGAAFSLTPGGTDVKPMYFSATDMDGVYVPLTSAEEAELNELLGLKETHGDDMEDEYPDEFTRMNELLAKSTTEPYVGGGVGGDYKEKDPMNGRLLLLGLAGGTYSLMETKAPEGYQKMEEPEALTIGDGDRKYKKIEYFDYEIGNNENDEHHHYDDKKDDNFPIAAYYVRIDDAPAVNILPETGGTGTKLFIIIGSLVALGAGVFFMTNQRMRKEGY